jgi:hypothetical protein
MLEIIELAKQSDLMADGEMWFSPTYGNSDVHITDLERFAKLVAATEREACAKVCETMARRTNDIRRAALEMAVENIMARGQA